jgi:hypothetical protein
MKRPANLLFSILIPLIGLASAGCQRSMNGSMATGPFAPAGSMAPAGNSPLIPIGPVSGATRVPPPATGSSSSANGYLGAAMSPAPNAGLVSSFDSGSNEAQWNQTMASAPPSSFRSSLGGMPINDLTNQGSVSLQQAPPSSFAGGNQAGVVGSGVAYPASYAASETSAWAQQPADLLRPIDTPYAAVPVPRYRGMEQPYNGAVQPAGGFVAVDSWQTTQPIYPQENYPETASASAPVRQTSMTPSTDPIGNQSPAFQTSSPSLPWRSPTTAR